LIELIRNDFDVVDPLEHDFLTRLPIEFVRL
jgi:hypothetical protein